MLKMTDIREWVSGLGVTDDSRVYIGKLDNKKQKSIGVYSRKREMTEEVALGGREMTSCATKSISILIHWNKSLRESEEAAQALFAALQNASVDFTIGDANVCYIALQVQEPVDVGTDDSGVYEFVIWVDFIYQRK